MNKKKEQPFSPRKNILSKFFMVAENRIGIFSALQSCSLRAYGLQIAAEKYTFRCNLLPYFLNAIRELRKEVTP